MSEIKKLLYIIISAVILFGLVIGGLYLHRALEPLNEGEDLVVVMSEVFLWFFIAGGMLFFNMKNYE